MKKAIKSIIVIIVFLSIPLFSVAQTPPHPNGGGGPGSGNTPVGGGAPIGGGLVILMSLGMAYASRKIYKFRN
jgi:hypothetical protein